MAISAAFSQPLPPRRSSPLPAAVRGPRWGGCDAVEAGQRWLGDAGGTMTGLLMVVMENKLSMGTKTLIYI